MTQILAPARTDPDASPVTRNRPESVSFCVRRERSPSPSSTTISDPFRERQVTVRVIDDGGVPLAGSEVFAWHLEKPRKGEMLNADSLAFHAKTDGQGRALFRSLPIDIAKMVIFFSENEDYSRGRAEYEPGAEKNAIDLAVQPRVTVRGKVTFANGLSEKDLRRSAARKWGVSNSRHPVRSANGTNSVSPRELSTKWRINLTTVAAVAAHIFAPYSLHGIHSSAK